MGSKNEVLGYLSKTDRIKTLRRLLTRPSQQQRPRRTAREPPSPAATKFSMVLYLNLAHFGLGRRARGCRSCLPTTATRVQFSSCQPQPQNQTQLESCTHIHWAKV